MDSSPRSLLYLLLAVLAALLIGGAVAWKFNSLIKSATVPPQTPVLPSAVFADQIETSLLSQTPSQIKELCTSTSEVPFVTAGGYHANFRGKATNVLHCDNGNLWVANEDGSIYTEGGTFYFDKAGKFIDICQLLFRPEVCKRYEKISCGERNYCE